MSEDLDSSDIAQAKTSFGFTRVREDAKQGLVNEVFAKVARNYDLMNDLMSGGLHRLWRNDLVAWLAPPKNSVPYALLDVAGGTGDVALRVLEASGPSRQMNEVFELIDERMLQTQPLQGRNVLVP